MLGNWFYIWLHDGGTGNTFFLTLNHFVIYDKQKKNCTLHIKSSCNAAEVVMYIFGIVKVIEWP